MTERQYRFGDDARREQQRLAALERVLDPPTMSILTEVGVRRGWHCWEVGAGRGSVARWLARVAGATGRVLATDLEDRWSGQDNAGVTFIQHDITSDPLPDGEFDLVHARFLLEHLSAPREVIARLRDSLRPGGVLVLEDSAGLRLKAHPPACELGPLSAAWEQAALTVGWNATYGADLMSDLRQAELVRVRGRQYRQLAPGGDEWIHICYGIERLREPLDQRLGASEVERALDHLTDCARLITGPPVTIAWGHRTER